jgi:hypothetical protein
MMHVPSRRLKTSKAAVIPSRYRFVKCGYKPGNVTLKRPPTTWNIPTIRLRTNSRQQANYLWPPSLELFETHKNELLHDFPLLSELQWNRIVIPRASCSESEERHHAVVTLHWIINFLAMTFFFNVDGLIFSIIIWSQ